MTEGEEVVPGNSSYTTCKIMTIDGAGELRFDPGPDYRGRFYSYFEVYTSPSDGPGWYVFGRCLNKWMDDSTVDIRWALFRLGEFTGSGIIRLCARPNVKRRKNPNYNIQVCRGWPTKKAAQAAAHALNVIAEAKEKNPCLSR